MLQILLAAAFLGTQVFALSACCCSLPLPEAAAARAATPADCCHPEGPADSRPPSSRSCGCAHVEARGPVEPPPVAVPGTVDPILIDLVVVEPPAPSTLALPIPASGPSRDARPPYLRPHLLIL